MAKLLGGTRIYGNITIDTQAFVSGNTVSTSTSTGAVIVQGGVGIVGNINAGGNISAVNLIGSHANGNSNVNIPTANGNITISASGVSNVVVVSNSGVNVTGTLTVSGTTVPRVVNITDGSTFTANSATTDIASQVNTQVSGTLTLSAPTGSPLNGQKLMYKIKSANVQTFSWDPVYAFSTDISQPTATTGSNKTDYLGFIYDSTASKWQLIAKNFGF